MSDPLFDIVFYGITQPGKDRDVVLENMAQLFKTTPEKVRPYFEGGRKIIKSSVDELTAEKYRAALENVGLVIKLEQAESEAGSTDAAPAPATVSGQAAATGENNGITIAPVGVDVLEHPPVVEPQPIGDISDITLAELGADIIENPPAVEPQPIDDINGISVAEVGADIIENPPVVEPQPIDDISDITMAETGADIIVNPKPKKKAPIPDTSDLSVEDN